MSRRLILLTLCLIAGALIEPALAGAQPATQLAIVHIDPTQWPLISADIASDQDLSSDTTPSFKLEVASRPVEIVDMAPVVQPGAACIVTDLSPRMSDSAGPYRTRFEAMIVPARDLLQRLMSVPDYQAGLVSVTQTVTVAQALRPDLVGVDNILRRASSALVFAPQPLNQADAAGAYPLNQAIQECAKQLQQVPAPSDRSIVVFAAGDANRPLGAQVTIPPPTGDQQPIHLLIVGIGSDQPGKYTAYPADQQGLAQFAQVSDGTYVGIAAAGGPVDAQTKQNLDAAFTALVRRTLRYRIRFTMPDLPAGPAELAVLSAGQRATANIQVASLPPRVSVVADAQINGQSRLAIKPLFQQQPIAEVTYLLNNISVAPPISAGAEFTLDLNTDAPHFAERFPPGPYQLVAAVKDQQGNESRSAPMSVVVTAPGGIMGALQAMPPVVGGLALGLGIGGLLALALLLRQRRHTRRAAIDIVDVTPSPNRSHASESTELYIEGDVPTSRVAHIEEDEHTARVTPQTGDITDRVLLTPTAPLRRWYAKVLVGDEERQYALGPLQCNYLIGRQASSKRTPDITLRNQYVSRQHARLELTGDKLDLIEDGGVHGTFFGEERRRLADGERVTLQHGDVFWISEQVKLGIERVEERYG